MCSLEVVDAPSTGSSCESVRSVVVVQLIVSAAAAAAALSSAML
jgi:hypothetical protein